MNNYYMQMQYQQQMNQEGNQTQQQNVGGDMIMENKHPEPENQQAQLLTPYNTQLDFEKV